MAEGMAGLGVITLVANFEKFYEAGFAAGWWGMMLGPVSLLVTLSGFVIYRYRETRAMLEEGVIGQLLSIDANDNISPAHGGYIMANWRRKSELAGPHILEKCVHDLDLLNWFVGALPRRVAAFGGRDFFLPCNRHLEERYDWTSFRELQASHRIETPFKDDSDLMDNLVLIMRYRNRVRVQLQATMSNAIPERRMYFSGSEGTLIANSTAAPSATDVWRTNANRP